MNEAERRAYHAWLRTHHPDMGGDRDAFEAGLRAWRARPEPHDPGTAVRVYRQPRGPGARLAWHLARRRARRERRLRLR